MADKKIVCKKCNVCVHPVVPCSHTIEKEYFCESCFNLPSDNPSTTSKKDAPSKPGASPQLEDEADPEAKANPEASGRLPQPEDEEEDANPNLEEESNKKKKRKRRPRTKRGGLPSRTSPRNKQKPTETAGATDDSDKKAVVKELFKSNEKQGTVPVETIPRKKQNLGKPTGPPPPNKDDFVPPKEQEVDDPLSRIDPSPPLVPEAKLPAKSDAATDKVDDAETDKVDDDLKLPADSVRGDPKAKSKKKKNQLCQRAPLQGTSKGQARKGPRLLPIRNLRSQNYSNRKENVGVPRTKGRNPLKRSNTRTITPDLILKQM
jgi:hypothetical protein